MKHFSNALLLFFLIASSSLFAQIGFKSGFFLDNNGNKIECLIKDVDWKSNPVAFDYKLSENDVVQTGKIENVQEFQVGELTKYIRKTVNIDRWDKYMPPSKQKQPVYNSEILFLKILVDGSATLYEYSSANFNTYFYSIDGASPQQLIQKQYVVNDGAKEIVYKNDMFKLQLQSILGGELIRESDTKNLSYFKSDFVRIFEKYNQSKGEVRNMAASSSFKFQVTPRIGLNQNNVKVDVTFQDDSLYKYDFGNESNLRVGLELEGIFPFSRGKWSMILEPSYTSYVAGNNGTEYTDDIAYKVIEVFFGGRHYMFLNDESRLFLNAGIFYSFDINNNLYFPQRRVFGTSFEVKPQAFVGAGYRYKKLSAEFRYSVKQNLVNRDYLELEYRSYSLNLGYTIF